MNDPSTTEEWMAVARERGDDAGAVLARRPRSAGAVYLAGYAVECALKGLILLRGVRPPRGRDTGHDLGALWFAAGFHSSDLHDPGGVKVRLLQQWGTGLRYQQQLPDRFGDADKMVAAARQLSGWVHKQVKRNLHRGRRPRKATRRAR